MQSKKDKEDGDTVAILYQVVREELTNEVS